MILPQWIIDIQHAIDQIWEISVLRMLILLVLYLIILWVLLKFTDSILGKYRKRFETSTIDALRSIIKIMIVSFLFTGYLNQFDQFQGIFLGFAAILGTAIGFASTQSIGNFIAGIYLIISRPFRVGDYVMLPAMSIEGIVIEITINYTVVKQANQTTAKVTNKSILDTRIINTAVMLPAIKDLESDKVTNRKWKKILEPLAGEKKKKVFSYPILFGNEPNQFKRVEQAINATIEQVRDRLISDPSWYVLTRFKLETKYEMVIMVEEPESIFDLVSEILMGIETRMALSV